LNEKESKSGSSVEEGAAEASETDDFEAFDEMFQKSKEEYRLQQRQVEIRAQNENSQLF
jgi:hypothetical protein